MMTPAPLPPAPHAWRQRGLMVMVFNTVIALSLISTGWHNWDVQMVYSQAIGLSIWTLIESGKHLFRRDPDQTWPRGWRAALLVSCGLVGGNILGTLVGDQYSGNSRYAFLHQTPRAFFSYLALSAGVGISITFFFVSRGKGERLQRLIDQTRREAAENQLKLLQSQLEPHMLFNTLANLRVLIGMDPPRAQLMLDHLNDFLRSTLTASRSLLHPLSAEFARTEDYVALMKIRMGDRLQTELHLPADLAHQAVPPLLLQPLVENAIKHGLEQHVDGGCLRIHARRDGHHLLLEVRDTGAGLAPTPAPDGTGFGLTQIRERLATLYGAQATFTLTPATDPEGGTLAAIRIPLDPNP